MLFYLSFYQQFEVFLEEPDKVKFFQSFLFIKVLDDTLEVLKLRSLVLNFFELKLRVPFNSTLSCIDKNSRVIKIFLKKNLKLSPYQGFYLILIFILI